MIPEEKLAQDPRLNEVLDLILQITSGNLEARGLHPNTAMSWMPLSPD